MERARRASVVALVLGATSCTSTGREPVSTGPAASVAYTAPPSSEHSGERYESQSSASTAEGAAWEFAEGLSIRITGVTRLGSQLGARTRGDLGLALVRVDFSYTNNGPAVNISEGRQLPVRLLHGDARDEATQDAGYAETAAQLTVKVPTSVASGTTVHGASSFAVPVSATDALAVLVVEPYRYTEHLFTDVDQLLGP